MTHPDITVYATNKCREFASKPNITHLEAAKRIMRYPIQTREHAISYQREEEGIKGYTHKLAGDKNNQKSTTGWLFTYNGAPIS